MALSTMSGHLEWSVLWSWEDIPCRNSCENPDWVVITPAAVPALFWTANHWSPLFQRPNHWTTWCQKITYWSQTHHLLIIIILHVLFIFDFSAWWYKQIIPWLNYFTTPHHHCLFLLSLCFSSPSNTTFIIWYANDQEEAMDMQMSLWCHSVISTNPLIIL